MNLKIENGQLDMPKDFSFELVRSNPFMSDEGDATIPVKLPSSENNLKTLGHIERIDRIGTNLTDVDAVLQIGTFSKKGKLLIGTSHQHDGINISLAFENSSMYCAYKTKTIKQIFGDYNNGDGYKDTTHVGIENIVNHLQNIYDATYAGVDYTVFPIGVSKYDKSGEETYQINNEFIDHTLTYETRIVREDDKNITVPKGYGVSPFIYLHRMLTIMFQIMGYTVSANHFNASWMRQIVLLNNVSDTIVRGEINYIDLVPSCTLSELLQWLSDKFHVCVRVDSSDKRIYIVAMETLLGSSADEDYTNKMQGDPTLTYNKTSRVVLSSGTSIEGAEPAADTFDALIDKFEGFFPVREAIYNNMKSGTFQYHDCLILRIATGEFFEIRTNLNTGKDTLIRLGSNYFKYDRKNSEESEERTAIDEMPPMVVQGKYFLPYVGNRKHAHTTLNDSEKDTEQSIIIVQEVFPSSNSYYQLRIGTTQGIVPTNTPTDQYLVGTLINYQCYTLLPNTQPLSIYKAFWKDYNKQLRNGQIEVETQMLFRLADLNMDMTALKMIRNQRLIAQSFNIPISEKMGLANCKFIVVKDNSELVEDSDVEYITTPRLKWSFTGSQVLADLWSTLVLTSYNGYEDLYDLLYDQYMSLIIPGGQTSTPAYIARPTGDYLLVFTDGIDTLYAHTPSVAGEISPAVTRLFTMRIKMERYTYNENLDPNYGTFHDYYYIDFPNQTAIITYTAVSY